MLFLLHRANRLQTNWEERLRNDLFCIGLDIKIEPRAFGSIYTERRRVRGCRCVGGDDRLLAPSSTGCRVDRQISRSSWRRDHRVCVAAALPGRGRGSYVIVTSCGPKPPCCCARARPPPSWRHRPTSSPARPDKHAGSTTTSAVRRQSGIHTVSQKKTTPMLHTVTSTCIGRCW